MDQSAGCCRHLQRVGHHTTFGKSGYIKSQRSCSRASRFGQSALSISRHFIMLPLAAISLDQLADEVETLAVALVHSTRSTPSLPSMSPKIRYVRGIFLSRQAPSELARPVLQLWALQMGAF